MEALPMDGNPELNFCCRVWSDRSGEWKDSELARTLVDTSTTKQQHTASMKIALLIGNWKYENTEELEQVRSDVSSLHDLLSEMEFHVVSLCNLSKREIQVAVERFCKLIIPG